MFRIVAILFLFFANVLANAQGIIQGQVKDEAGNPLPLAIVSLRSTEHVTETNVDGHYEIKNVPKGNYTLMAFAYGKSIAVQEVIITNEILIANFTLTETIETLEEVVVEAERERTLGMRRLNAIENFGVYEGKKTEVIVLKDLIVNTATNNARQIYGKVTGLNIWESDGAGIQLGIGGRGLSPNRTANFNTRQNGYDISADALGYPESYYTPPADALEQIEIVRGAASLQYGTQFGGLLNFKFKKGPENKKIEFTTRHTIGPWNFYGTFNSIGGTVAKGKLNYYAYYNFKTGDGYRDNSQFDYHNAYASIIYKVNQKLDVNVDYTKMTYLAKQPGGLTDVYFAQDPRQSNRARNWFKVDWNLFAMTFTYKFSPTTSLNIRNFGLIATRQSLGYLKKANVSDMGEFRTMIDGEFNNFGNETRVLHRYKIGRKQNALVAGFRFYRGTTYTRQGDADNGTAATFKFLHPDDLENLDYKFPNENYSVFLENIFDLSSKISITPGLRYENIRTYSKGYYKQILRNSAGTVLVQRQQYEDLSRTRSFILAGLGVSYKHSDVTEIYGNFSQNYRAINFTDLRIDNPNLKVDSTLHDEKGFTADLGIRGTRNVFRYEVTGFFISYQDRIGQAIREDKLFNEYRYRTNIADAYNIGVEAFGEVVLSKLINPETEDIWSWFFNGSVIDARYIRSKEASIKNRNVEMVPPFMIRTGSTFKRKNFSTTAQFSFISKHYSDATNAEWTPSGIEGEIPSYMIVDLSASYSWKILSLDISCNNLLNESYYTRRADSYPGPGIIPSDGRGIYVTLQARVGK